MAKHHIAKSGGWLYDYLNYIDKTLKNNSDSDFRRRFVEVVNENARSSQNHINTQGFFFRGELFHKLAPGIPTRGLAFGSLSPELIPKMEIILKDRQEQAFQLTRIRNGLSLVLTKCQDLQDIRDSLPNCLVDLIPDLAPYPRAREEAFLIKDDYSKYRQYELIKPLIEFYCAMRFFT